MECDQREAAELAASLATKRAGQAPFQRKRGDSSPPQTTRIPTRGFREPNPKTNTVQDKTLSTNREGRKERQIQRAKEHKTHNHMNL